MVASSAVVAVLASTTQPDAVTTPDADTVSPGFAGFMTVFLIAVATLFLLRSMTKHMRKAKFLADEQERLMAQDSESSQSSGPAAVPGESESSVSAPQDRAATPAAGGTTDGGATRP